MPAMRRYKRKDHGMRISTAQMQSQAVRSMMERQVELSYTQQQVATGKRILSPSDDVIGSTQVIALQQNIDTSTQYQENADMAESRLLSEENALTQTINVLQRSRELAIQGNNGSQSASNRTALANEIRQNLAEILALANTVDGNGEYVFAGYNVGTAPFSEVENPVGSGLYDFNYSGDNGQRNLQIGATRQIPVGDPGSDVFVSIPVGGGGTQSVFETLEQLALSLESNSPNLAAVGDLQSALNHFDGFRAKVGARQNAIDSHRDFNEDVKLEAQKRLSEVQDLDYAEAISRLNLQQAGLEASQQSFARIQNLSLFNFL